LTNLPTALLMHVNCDLPWESSIGQVGYTGRAKQIATEDSAVLNAVLDATVDAMIVSDDSGTMLRINAAAGRMFLQDPTALVGQNVKILMPGVMAALHDGYMANHVKTGEKRIIGIGRDVEGQRKDGSIFPLHLSVGHTVVNNQRLFVGILHDLSHRKAAEDALARSQRLDAIGQMTGGIVHDFNNLLTVVIGNLELLEMRGADERQLALIKDALESAQLGADLTSRLMIFAGKSNLKPVKCDLRELCSRTLAMLKRTLGANIRIRTDFASNLREVMIDPVQLQSALMNLALNARDAMGAGGELLVSVEAVTIDDTYMSHETDIAPGNYVRLSVSDDGKGMSVEAQKRAFEPFFTTKAERGGTGLGLAVVHRFVRQSGGHIRVYSELGLGASFGLYFPAVSDAAEIPVTPLDATNVLPRGNGRTVLVVEDNPKVRRLSIERIQDLGFKTEAAENGDVAYKMLTDGLRADIVFSDIVMPGKLNGFALAALVEAEFPHIKILLSSGYASDVVASRIAHERPYEILHKPYRQSVLAERLQALLVDVSADDRDV
jgi:PAS domain S-box-containing protein